jgi:hypothetical protein
VNRPVNFLDHFDRRGRTVVEEFFGRSKRGQPWTYSSRWFPAQCTVDSQVRGRPSSAKTMGIKCPVHLQVVGWFQHHRRSGLFACCRWCIFRGGLVSGHSQSGGIGPLVVHQSLQVLLDDNPEIRGCFRRWPVIARVRDPLARNSRPWVVLSLIPMLVMVSPDSLLYLLSGVSKLADQSVEAAISSRACIHVSSQSGSWGITVVVPRDDVLLFLPGTLADQGPNSGRSLIISSYCFRASSTGPVVRGFSKGNKARNSQVVGKGGLQEFVMTGARFPESIRMRSRS